MLCLHLPACAAHPAHIPAPSPRRVHSVTKMPNKDVTRSNAKHALVVPNKDGSGARAKVEVKRLKVSK